MVTHGYRYTSNQRVARRVVLRSGGVAAAGLGALAVGCSSSKNNAVPSSTTSVPAAKPANGTAAPAAAASSVQPQTGGILSQRLQTDPATLDIHQTSTYGAVWPEAPCYNQIIQFDPKEPDTKIIPDLADAYEVGGDGLSIVFHLHPGVKFHDGSAFTSADAKATIDWIKNPPGKTASPRQGVLATVTSVEVPDAQTIKLILSRPTPSLLLNLSTHYMAVSSMPDLDKGDAGTNMNGTGPFKLKSYTRGVGIELERNPNYFVPGRPYLDGLKYSIVPDENTAFTGFTGGQFQQYYPIMAENLDRVAKETNGKAKVLSAVQPGGVYLFFNGKKKPYDDIRVRQAISLVLDRQACIQIVESGQGQIGCYMDPVGPWALPLDQLKAVVGYDKPDIAEAKKLLAAAGVTEPVSGVILTRSDQAYRDTATFIQATLKQAFGWNYTIDPKDSAAAYTAAYALQFDLIAWRLGLSLDDPDATFAEIATRTAVRNWSQIYDDQADALFDKQSQTLDVAARKKLVIDTALKYMNSFQVIGLEFAYGNHGQYNTVQNYTRPLSLYVNQRYQDVWLSKT